MQLGTVSPLSVGQTDALVLALKQLCQSPRGTEVVLGQGDCNLANFLWDGPRVRIVDFEDSGPSGGHFAVCCNLHTRRSWAKPMLHE
jgi:hypothetical protein